MGYTIVVDSLRYLLPLSNSMGSMLYTSLIEEMVMFVSCFLHEAVATSLTWKRPPLQGINYS